MLPALIDAREQARPWHLQPPTLDEFQAAAERISGTLVRTPLLESERLNRILGCRLFVKPEGLQRTGSFKARGAWNMISALAAEGGLEGIVCGSSGNHGQAAAWAAKRHGIPAIVMMPHDAPLNKVERTRAWGAEVLHYDRHREDREEIGRKLVAERGFASVPACEDRRIVAGAATLSLEMIDQAQKQSASLDRVVVGCSGGGMAAGCSLAMNMLAPEAKVWAVEPADYDDLARSLAAGSLLRNEGSRPSSICDSLMAPTTGALTFGIMSGLLSGTAMVTDQEVLVAMRVAFAEFGLVVEPGGAAGLAAILSGRIDVSGRNVAVVLSGSNVDAHVFKSALGESVQHGSAVELDAQARLQAERDTPTPVPAQGIVGANCGN